MAVAIVQHSQGVSAKTCIRELYCFFFFKQKTAYEIGFRPGVVAPDVIQDLRLREHPSLMTHQVLEKGELRRAHFDGAPVVLNAAPPEIELETVGLQAVHFADLDLPPGQSPQARHKFAEGEWLRQVVVSSGVQALHAIAHSSTSCEHEHGYIDVLAAQRAAN